MGEGGRWEREMRERGDRDGRGRERGYGRGR